jgi:hypothetical protein
MRIIKSILMCVFLLIGSPFIFIAAGLENMTIGPEQTSDQIEVKEDRFSGATTITLKPQVVVDKPDQQITMAIECKLGEKTRDRDDLERVKANVYFISESKSPVDFGDQELHFLIDGKPLNLGRINISVIPFDNDGLKPGFKHRDRFLWIFNRSNVEQFSKASRIEMRIGAVESTLSQPVALLLREYCAKLLAKHKIILERKQ